MAAQPCAPSTVVLDEIAAERRRQVEVEGWTAEHDDQHIGGGMAAAAGCYATAARWWQLRRDPASLPESIAWPWALRWWKPKDARADLIRAGALIVAEVERLDRAAARRGPA